VKPEDVRALISYRMDRSRESILAAEIMLEKEMLTISMNRIYYSVFYAVQALLVLDGVNFSKHGQVKGYFNRKFIKTGIFSMEIGRFYNKAFEYRQKFDYVDFAEPEVEMVSDYIEKANKFNEKIMEYIRSREGNP